MHLRNVEIFCDVVACRSFSRAAEQHGVSQSSASQAVNALEKRLGVQLIDRSKRPFELTCEGQVYYDGCRNLLESFRKIEDQVLQLKNRVTGRVRVAAIYSVGLLQLDSYRRKYLERYPDVELQIEYLHPDEVYERVNTDDADLGLVSFPREGGDFTRIAWQEQEMALVVPPDHKLAGRGSVPIAEIDDQPFVTFTSELKIRRQLDRWLKEADVSVRLIHEFDNIENIKQAVEIGSGVAILPVPTIRREVAAGTLSLVRLQDVTWSRPLGIVHKRHKNLTVAAKKLVELLREDSGDARDAAGKPLRAEEGAGDASTSQRRAANTSSRKNKSASSV